MLGRNTHLDARGLGNITSAEFQVLLYTREESTNAKPEAFPAKRKEPRVKKGEQFKIKEPMTVEKIDYNKEKGKRITN